MKNREQFLKFFNSYKRADYWGLFAAAQINDSNLIEFYLQRVAKKDIKRQKCLDLGLKGAIRGGHLNLVNYFLNLGADNYTECMGEAVCSRNTEIAKILSGFEIQWDIVFSNITRKRQREDFNQIYKFFWELRTIKTHFVNSYEKSTLDQDDPDLRNI